ncbi:HAD family hydrolase [Deltaproteobacteria bacterium TL4]
MPLSLAAYQAIFWDFDGVIKESGPVKTSAFRQLFEAYGESVQAQVQAHHEANGGMSRFLKIPIYWEYAGLEVEKEEIEHWCERFSQLVVDNVIQAPWVSGAEAYIRQNYKTQPFFLLTGTPHDEILYILEQINLLHCFRAVYGAPHPKPKSIQAVLQEHNYTASQCLMIGDALVDYHAAEFNQIDFLLRSTSENESLFASITCKRITDFDQL